MTSRWKKVFADFWGNKARTVLTILTIMVGTFAVGFNSNLGLYMLDSMDGDYLSASPSEGTVFASPITDGIIEIARNVPGVEAVEGRSIISAHLIHPGLDPVSVQFTAIEDPESLTLNLLEPASGETSIPKLTDRQVILDASVMPLGYKPGDTLRVQLDSGRVRELVLAGYVHAPTGIPYNLAKIIDAYVTPDTVEWLGGDRGFNSLAISVSEKQTDQRHVTDVSQAVADRIERAGAQVYYVNVYRPGHHFAWSTAQGMFSLLGILSYLTVLLSAFLIINTIAALMSQQSRQIGIMKAVGGATGQVFGMYIVLILAFGALALLLAIPLANSAASTIGAGMAAYLNFYAPLFKSYPETLIQQAIVSLLIPVLAAVWPIYNSVRMTVREAISDYGIGGNLKPKDKSVNRAAVLIPRPIRLSLRNAFRRKARLTLTLFTLVLGGAVFISVYNLWETFDKTLKDVQGYFLADINIGFSRYYRFDEVASIAQSVPGVSSVEGWTQVPGTLLRSDQETGTQIMFMAPPSNSTLIRPVIASGRWLREGDENAVVIGNYLLSMFPDLSVGDTLRIKINEKETAWRIIGTYTITGNTGVPLMYVNYEYLSRRIGLPGQVYSVRVLTDQHDLDSEQRISKQMEALYEARGIQYASTELGAQWIQDQKAQTDIFVYFMLVMASLVAAVGGLGLMSTMSINVLERTREIGVMRAIGASNGDIQSIVITEGVVVGVVSWAISILFSFPITAALTYGVGMAILTAPMPPVYGVSGIAAWLFFTLVLASVASALPAQRASGLAVRETLVYE